MKRRNQGNSTMKRRERLFNADQQQEDENGSDIATTDEAAEAIRNTFSQIPFEELLQMQKTDKNNSVTKALRLAHSAKKNETIDQKCEKDFDRMNKLSKEEIIELNRSLSKERQSKSAPVVLSSKIPVSRKRQVFSIPPKPTRRDPRFDELSGQLDTEQFKQSYEFLGDYQQAEIDRLRNDPTKQKEYAQLMTKIGEAKRRAIQTKAKRVVKEFNTARVKQGKAPVFVSRRKLEQISQQFAVNAKSIKRNVANTFDSKQKNSLLSFIRTNLLEDKTIENGMNKDNEKRLKRKAAKQHTSLPKRRKIE